MYDFPLPEKKYEQSGVTNAGMPPRSLFSIFLAAAFRVGVVKGVDGKTQVRVFPPDDVSVPQGEFSEF